VPDATAHERVRRVWCIMVEIPGLNARLPLEAMLAGEDLLET